MSGVKETQGDYDVLLQLDNRFNFVKLGEVSRVIMGQAPPSSTCSENPVGMPFLQGNAEFGARHPISKQYCSITPRQAEIGDILISVRAPVGEVNVADQPYVIGRGLAAIHPTKINQNFAWHSIRFFAPELEKVAQGSTFTAIGRQELENIEIPTFGESTDKRIAAVLDTLDTDIEKSEALIAKLKQVRAGMLHDLLTCGVDENGEIRDIEDGNHPETWQTDFLGNVVDFYSGGTPSKSRPEYWQGGFPLLTPKDMKRFELNDTSDHVTEEAASHSSKIMPSGTLFIVVRGMILAHTFPVCLNRRPFAFNQDIKAIRGREGLNTRFLGYWFLANAWKFLRKATEATHGTKKLDLDDLQKAHITFPPLTEQSVILDLIEGANEELESEQRELFILRQLKQGLTTDLLTGQVRVPPDLELP